MKTAVGIMPFLTFSGCAKDAVNYYVTVFPNSKIDVIEYYKKEQRGYAEGKIINVNFTLMNQPFMAMDFNESGCPEHNWVISFYMNCIDEEMFNTIFEKLSAGGKVLMGPESINNIRKAAWVTDKFGITWQIIWE